MPYGHIRQYQELVAEAEQKRIQITKQQQRQIAKMYRDIAKDLGHDIAKKSEKTLTERWLKDYAKELKKRSRMLFEGQQSLVSRGILDAATAVTDAQFGFWAGVKPLLSERFRDVFSDVPQSCVNELMNGGIYKDFTGLSERLWDYKRRYSRDIDYVINRGIIQQKSTYDLAKDLETYLRPGAKKPWEWRKVYPGCNQVVDYNAQRLSRTSVTHAYQMSFQRSTKDNPFIERYQWHSANAGKTCDLCRERDGRLYDKDKVPLDHPNGMCIITAVIPKSYDEIASDLSGWAQGKENTALDKWLGIAPGKVKMLSEMNIKVPDSIFKASGMTTAVKQEMQSAVDKLKSEYYIFVDSIEADSFEDESGIFVAGPYEKKNGVLGFAIAINTDIDYTRLINIMEDRYNSGYYAGRTFEDYIAHEMAHILMFQECSTPDEYFDKLNRIDAMNFDGISIYASNSGKGSEQLAEAFVKYRNGEKIPEKARKIIEKEINRWRKH